MAAPESITTRRPCATERSTRRSSSEATATEVSRVTAMSMPRRVTTESISTSMFDHAYRPYPLRPRPRESST